MMEFEVRHWMTNHEADIGKFGQEQSAARRFATLTRRLRPRKKDLGPASGKPNTIGNIFYGPKGYLAIQEYDDLQVLARRAAGAWSRAAPAKRTISQNFIDCVRSRKAEDLNAPIEEGHISATLVHLANVSYRLGPHAELRSGNRAGDRRRRSQPSAARGRPRLSSRASRFRTRSSRLPN